MEQPSRLDRYKSLTIDFIIIFEITILLMHSPSYMIKFVAILIPLVYFLILHTLLSRSIGDIVFKLKIVDQQGNKIGFRLALKRFLGVLKFSIFALLLTNLLFLFYFLSSRRFKDIPQVLDYEEESQTYLAKTG